MEGGEITGNGVNATSNSSNSVVTIRSGSTFEMSGGAIYGNARYNANVFVDDHNCTFRLSGSAEIASILLYATNNTSRSTITFDENFSGTVTSLHLDGNSNSASTVATFWTNAPVIVNGTASVISMFNNGGLGNFTNSYQGYTSTGTSIRATHELNSDGVLVLK